MIANTSGKPSWKPIVFVLVLCFLIIVVVYSHGDYSSLTPKNSTVPLKTKPLNNVSEFFDYLDRHKLHCKQVLRIGGVFHHGKLIGGENVCIEGTTWHPRTPCIVFSFGLSYEATFETVLGQYGCKVFAYDPFKALKVKIPNIYYFDIGIWSQTKVYQTRGGPVEMNRYSKIISNLKMENATVSFIRMDAEGGELEFFKDVLTRTPHLITKVDQIGVHIHLNHPPSTSRHSPSKISAYYEHFRRLEQLGFQIVFVQRLNLHNEWFMWNGKPLAKKHYVILRRKSQSP